MKPGVAMHQTPGTVAVYTKLDQTYALSTPGTKLALYSKNVYLSIKNKISYVPWKSSLS